MDFPPPPFHLVSSWYVLWALWVGSFWKCQHQGHLSDSLCVTGGGTLRRPGSQLPAFACFSPSSPMLPPGPSSALLLSVDDFYLYLLGVGVRVSPPLTLTPQFAPSVSVQLLCLWIVQRSCKNAMKVKT